MTIPTTHTIFDADGLPLQQVLCTDDDLTLYLARFPGASARPGSHLACRLVRGDLVAADVRTPERAMADLRQARDAALKASDVLALRSLEALLPPALQAYREELRALPSVVVDPFSPVDLPVPPPID